MLSIASLSCWKLSMLGHMNLLYESYIYISHINLLINFSIGEPYPKKLQNSHWNEVTAKHLLSCFVGGEIELL